MGRPGTDSESLAWVEVGDRVGFIDTTGHLAINPQFEEAWPFHAGLARVRLDSAVGYVDAQSRYVYNLPK